MPFGGAQVLALLITGFLAGRIKNCRIILMCGGLVVAILGLSLMYALPEENKLGRLLYVSSLTSRNYCTQGHY